MLKLILKETNMYSEQTTSQIKVVEQPAKLTKIIKIKYKKLYQYKLKRRKNTEISLEQQKKELEQLKKKLNDNKIEIETLKQNLETKNKELTDLKKTKGSQCSVEGSKYEKTIHNLIDTQEKNTYNEPRIIYNPRETKLEIYLWGISDDKEYIIENSKYALDTAKKYNLKGERVEAIKHKDGYLLLLKCLGNSYLCTKGFC